MEIASALQRSSGSAAQAGVSFEELASYITVLSSTTRRSAETIGESLKTIFARMSDLKMGFDVDDGTSISNVEDALSDVGIKLRDSKDSFRDFSDVLQELSGKWDTLTEVEQANLGKQIAGTRQRELFYVLMTNMEKALEFQEIQTNASGLALERYGEYLDGVEAAQNRFNASWEKLAQNSLESGVISNFYDALAGILGFIDTIGGLPTILTLTAIGLTVAYAGTLTFAGALGILEGALLAVEATMTAMNPAAWALIAVGAIVMIVNSIETAEEKLSRLNSEIEKHNENINKLRDNAKSISELSSKYEELNKTYKDTGIMSQEFLDVQNQLKELIPELSGHFDEYGNFILDADNDMKNLNASTLEQIRLEKELRQAKLDEKADVQAKNLLDLQRKKISTSAKGGSLYTESEKIQINLDWSNALKESKTAFNEMSEEGKQAFISSLMESGSQGEEIAKIFIQEINKGIAEQEIQLFGDPESIIAQGTKAGELAYTGLSETIKSLADSTTDDLIEKSMKGELDFEDVPKIPEEYLSALDVVNGKLRLNIDTIKELQLAEAEAAVQSAINAGAKQSEIDVLQLYYEQLLAESQATFGQFNQTAWAYDELLWKISNDAFTAGYSFTDMEGKALTSAQAIFDYMAKGDAQFNSVIAQIAQQTGLSVVEVMNMVNAEIDRTAARAASVMAGLGAGFTPAPPMFPTPSIPAPSTGGGGSGGSGSDEYEKQREEAERLREEAERLREVEREIEEARKKAIDALKKQLSLYKQMIDKKKDLLDAEKKERDYQQDLEEQQNNIAKIQNQIAELSLDDSEEAKAQVLALQEQLAKAQKDLENTEYDHSIEEQKEALDKEYARVEKIINRALEAISKINASSLDSFSEQLAKILAKISKKIPEFHTGGVVGGVYQNKENEQFATLLKKEVVVTPEQMSNFMNKTLPTIMSGTPSVSSTLQGMEIGQLMNFNINGGLDKSVLPSIEKIANMVVDKLNDNMLIRGTKRGAGLFSA